VKVIVTHCKRETNQKREFGHEPNRRGTKLGQKRNGKEKGSTQWMRGSKKHCLSKNKGKRNM